tara:strand:+ start:297 stop:560 length:264 start_codon:yes stop_codon:yes gene_type:complete
MINKYTLATQKTLAELCVNKEDQLKALQDAVNALRPHHRRFGTDHQFNFHGKGLQCTHCDRVDGHWDSCPVTKLREVIKEQGVSDEG